MSQTFNSVFDWHKCVLCQRETREALRCPGNTIADANATTGHETLSRIIPQFRDLKMKLTLHATIIELVDGGTLKETFKSRNAKWHKSCYGKFTITNLRQAEKRKSCDIIPSMGKLTQMFNRINQEFQERWQDRVVMPLPIGKLLWGRESLYFDVRSEKGSMRSRYRMRDCFESCLWGIWLHGEHFITPAALLHCTTREIGKKTIQQ